VDLRVEPWAGVATLPGALPMNIHEYQAKQLLARFGVVVPEGRVAGTVDEARTAAKELFARGALRSW